MINNFFSPPHKSISQISALYFPEQEILYRGQTSRNFIADLLLKGNSPAWQDGSRNTLDGIL